MRHQKGQVLVETAIILPLLLLMIFAVFDYARAMYTRNTLNNAARAGARVAAVIPGLTVTGADGTAESGPVFTSSTSTATVLQNNIFNGIDKDNSVTYKLQVMDVSDPTAPPVWRTGAAKGGDLVQVTVTWSSFKMVTPIYTLLAWVTGNSVDDQSTKTIIGEASMRRE